MFVHEDYETNVYVDDSHIICVTTSYGLWLFDLRAYREGRTLDPFQAVRWNFLYGIPRISTLRHNTLKARMVFLFFDCEGVIVDLYFYNKDLPPRVSAGSILLNNDMPLPRVPYFAPVFAAGFPGTRGGPNFAIALLPPARLITRDVLSRGGTFCKTNFPVPLANDIVSGRFVTIEDNSTDEEVFQTMLVKAF
jgi:hypothetical protein